MIQRRVIAATLAGDPGKAFVGTSPAPGDMGYVGIVLPPGGVNDQYHRVLVRLCSVAVPEGMVGRILTIGQLLTLSACVPAEPEQGEQQRQRTTPCDQPSIRFERPVTTPWWSFPDGNVSWHLRAYQNVHGSDRIQNPGIPARDMDLGNLDSSILVTAWPPVPFNANPLNHGVPPGIDIGTLGTWHSLDYGWPGSSVEMVPQPEVRGPCIIGMFASVYQTDTLTRRVPATGPGLEQMTVDSGLLPEDAFWLAFPDTARYHRIAGRLVVDIRCDERRVNENG